MSKMGESASPETGTGEMGGRGEWKNESRETERDGRSPISDERSLDEKNGDGRLRTRGENSFFVEENRGRSEKRVVPR